MSKALKPVDVKGRMQRSELRALNRVHEVMPDVMERIIQIALQSEDETTTLKAAQILIERGWGKSEKRVNIIGTLTREDSPQLKDIINMSPRAAYQQLASQIGKQAGEEIVGEIVS